MHFMVLAPVLAIAEKVVANWLSDRLRRYRHTRLYAEALVFALDDAVGRTARDRPGGHGWSDESREWIVRALLEHMTEAPPQVELETARLDTFTDAWRAFLKCCWGPLAEPHLGASSGASVLAEAGSDSTR